MNYPNHNEERRIAQRFALDWEVAVKASDTGWTFDEAGNLRDLSSLGAFMYLGRGLIAGASLEVQIQTPFKGNNWLIYRAEVVRVDFSEDKAGVAVRFDRSRPVFSSMELTGKLISINIPGIDYR